MNTGIKMFFGDVLALTAYRYQWEKTDETLKIKWQVGQVSSERYLDDTLPIKIHVHYKSKVAVFNWARITECSEDCSKGELLIYKPRLPQ